MLALSVRAQCRRRQSGRWRQAVRRHRQRRLDPGLERCASTDAPRGPDRGYAQGAPRGTVPVARARSREPARRRASAAPWELVGGEVASGCSCGGRVRRSCAAAVAPYATASSWVSSPGLALETCLTGSRGVDVACVRARANTGPGQQAWSRPERPNVWFVEDCVQ